MPYTDPEDLEPLMVSLPQVLLPFAIGALVIILIARYCSPYGG